jgi:hypothetical protein
MSLAGSIAFSANLRTPTDPLPAALVMGNSEDARPINEDLLWTASSLSVPRPRPDRRFLTPPAPNPLELSVWNLPLTPPLTPPAPDPLELSVWNLPAAWCLDGVNI